MRLFANGSRPFCQQFGLQIVQNIYKQILSGKPGKKMQNWDGKKNGLQTVHTMKNDMCLCLRSQTQTHELLQTICTLQTHYDVFAWRKHKRFANIVFFHSWFEQINNSIF